MNLLILKGFNNYFNRIIKKYNTIADYISHSDSHYDFSGINFNPNDGVTTTHIIGSSTQQQAGGPDLVPLAWEHDGNPDYLIAYETEQVGIATNTVIRSRWFVTESVRTRNGQYSLKLKRDSIADFLESLLSAPAFIKKGTVSDDNPLILNDEGVRVNQIKTENEFLKDESGSAWIVGYMPKNTGISGHQISCSVQGESNIEYTTITELAADLGVDEGELSDVLTTSSSNVSTFINGNIEIIGCLNHPNPVRTTEQLIAGSQNYLSSISYKNWRSNDVAKAAENCFADRKTVFGTNSINQHLADIWKNNVSSNVSTIKSNWNTLTSAPFLPKTVYTKLVELDGKYIFKNGNYYKINVGTSNSGYKEHLISSASSPFGTICSDTVSQWNTWIVSQGYSSADAQMSLRSPGKVQIYYNTIEAVFYLSPIGPEDGFPTISFTMSTNRKACEDQVFDMFAMPANAVQIIDGLNIYEGIPEYSQRLAVAIAGAAIGLDNDNPDLYALYDIQLLPYCPIPDICENGLINIGSLSSGQYDYITYSGPTTFVSQQYTPVFYSLGVYEVQQTIFKPSGTGTLTLADISVLWSNDNHDNESLTIMSQSSSTIKVSLLFDRPQLTSLPRVQFSWSYTPTDPQVKSIVIYPNSASFKANVNKALTLKNEMKIEALCNNYRLVAPNYQGSFDFNLAKNRGQCSGFRAYCTYKPYTPYIRVVPEFDWMYGINFTREARGLVCSGDFSLGRVNSQWGQYQLNNKNYQNIFNREIQNLDVNQSIQRTQQYVSGGLNIVRDAIAGGVGGFVASGSPYGAIAGAAIGGAGSGAGYAVDMNLMERSLKEQRQFSIDKYNMNIANIQAIQYTITKVGSFDIDSAVFPVLEYYTCTDVEKEALRMKIQYEGMTIGIVDCLGNYMNGGYVQADLIRNENIIEDSHLLDDIYIELTKGVYM